ncbi:unnamed protein product [Ectocarpus sp. CCAP 1310/34]|nr:unnamed protein product [Ectocarpus sp. CCAP 1310/34]
MYSLLEAAGKGAPTSPARDRPSLAGPPPAHFDLTGGNSITAGCFLGAAAAAAATPCTGPPPVTLSTAGTSEVPMGTKNDGLFGVRQRHPLLAVDGIARKRRHAGVSQKTAPWKNAKGPEQPGQTSWNTSITAVGLDKQQRSQQQGAAKTRKPTGSVEIPAMKIFHGTGSIDSERSPDVDVMGTNGGVSEFSSAHPSDDENGQGQYTTDVSSSSLHEESRLNGSAPVVVSHDRKEEGVAEEPAVPELLPDSPTTADDGINASFGNPPTSTRPLQPSKDGFGSFQIPGPTSFLMSAESPEDNTAASSTSVEQEAQSSYNGGACTREEQQSSQQHHQQQQQQRLRKGAYQKPADLNGKKRVGKTTLQKPGGKLSSSQRLDGIMAAYSNNNLVPPILPTSAAATKKETMAAKKSGAKRTVGGGSGDGGNKQARSSTRVGAGLSEDVSGGGGTTRWRQGESDSAAVRAAAKAAERMKRLEALMNAAMESPVTYEEQVRRERLAHLRVMYTGVDLLEGHGEKQIVSQANKVEKEMAELPVDFLRGVGYEDYGIKSRLSRMCAALGKSHRWSKAVALSRWAQALEKARADEFAEEMLRYEHARLFAMLSSIRKRWELKQARRRFLGWRKRVRLARLAEDQDQARVGAIKIQRWARRRLAARRRRRALEQRERRRIALARDKADAIAGVLSFEDNRRCQLLEYAEMERQELHRRRLAEHARRWAVILPMARGFLSACLDRSQRAVIAKLRARHETLRLAYEAELAEHRRVLNAAHAVISHAWRGKRCRLEFVARMKALVDVQRAWKRAAGRRRLQAEIDARVAATAQRIKKARESAASRLQAFARKSAQRHQLSKRFAARKAKLDFERRNRSELASACLVMFEPSRAIREAAGREDFEAMGDAVRPAEVVARLRASAAARGVSLSQIMSGAFDDDDGGDDEDGVGEDGVPKRLSGSELARAVLKQQESQRRAAEAVQLAWRKRKAMLHLEGLFAKRKVKILNDRRESSALRLQRVWASARLRVELAARVEATRRRIAAEREWGARMLQRLCRRRKDAKELASRFAIRKIILEQARSLREMNAAVSKIQLWYRRRQGVYYTTLRIVARYQLAYKEGKQQGPVHAGSVADGTWCKD